MPKQSQFTHVPVATKASPQRSKSAHYIPQISTYIRCSDNPIYSTLPLKHFSSIYAPYHHYGLLRQNIDTYVQSMDSFCKTA